MLEAQREPLTGRQREHEIKNMQLVALQHQQTATSGKQTQTDEFVKCKKISSQPKQAPYFFIVELINKQPNAAT